MKFRQEQVYGTLARGSVNRANKDGGRRKKKG